MTPTESFAAAVGISPADVTHCVLIGTRNGCDAYAVGYWGEYAYTSGTIDRRDDGTFGDMSYCQDIDIERITEPTAAATPSKTP